MRGDQRIVLLRFVKAGNSVHGIVKQRDLRGKHITEQTRNAQGHIHARASQLGEGQNLEAIDAGGAMVPCGPHTDQREGLCQIIAAGAHRGAAP